VIDNGLGENHKEVSKEFAPAYRGEEVRGLRKEAGLSQGEGRTVQPICLI
jgi:hypothetical protein